MKRCVGPPWRKWDSAPGAEAAMRRMRLLHDSGAFLLTRANRGVLFRRRYSNPVDATTGLRSDQTVVQASAVPVDLCIVCAPSPKRSWRSTWKFSTDVILINERDYLLGVAFGRDGESLIWFLPPS